MKKKENKTMKKVLTISALALLLGLVGYTGGSTFAKYVSKDELPATGATVAQWGFVTTINAENLIGTDYSGSPLASKVAAGSGVAVKSDDVALAPGTKGSMTVSVTGNAEVRAQITFNATFDGISLKKDPEVYNPIVYTVDDGTTSETFDTAEELNLHLNGYTKVYEVGSTAAINLTISWAWDLENSDSNIAGLSVNEADTILGVGSKAGYAVDKNASFGLTVTAEQIQ